MPFGALLEFRESLAGNRYESKLVETKVTELAPGGRVVSDCFSPTGHRTCLTAL
jgi:hypothetical protein